MTLTEALRTVQYGDITGDAAAQAIYSGIPSGQTVLALHPGIALDPAAWYNWSGRIPDTERRQYKEGWYWIAQPLTDASVQGAVDRYGWDAVCRIGKGIGKTSVAATVCALAEADHLTLDEQAAQWDRIATATGCPLSAAIMSGDPRPAGAQPGKSLHVYWALRQPCDRPTWDEIQSLLIALGRSDPAIQNPDRKMRRPGAHMDSRWQTVLLAHPNPVDPVLFLGGLRRMTICEGIADVQAAVGAIRWSHRLRKQGHDHLSGAYQDEIYAIADRTLTTREISDADDERAALLLGPVTPRPVGGSSGATGRAGSAIRERRTLPADYLISIPGGGMRLDAVTGHIRCRCPEHASVSGASAFADLSGDGHPYLCCPSCGLTWHADDPRATRWVLGQVVTGADDDGEAAADAVSTAVTLLPLAGTPAPPADDPPTEIVCQRYVPAVVPTARVTYIRSPQNTGKTYGLRGAATTAPSVLAISHRVSLVVKLCGDWVLANYQAVPKGDILEKRLGICLNSLPRVKLPGEQAAADWDARYIAGDEYEEATRPSIGYDLVILDESEQLFRHLYGGTVLSSHLAATYRALQTVLRSAKHIVCADADMTKLTVRAVRRMLGWNLDLPGDEKLIENQYRTRDRDIIAYQEKTDLIAKLQEDWLDGKRLWVACDSKRTAETIAHLLGTWSPNRPILTVTADTREDADPIALFRSPDTEIQKWDAVVVSPAVATGLSIDAVHIDAVYLCLGGGSVIAADGLQMAMRVRNPKERTIRAWITRRVEHRCTDPAQVKTDKEWLNSDGVKLALKWQVIDGVPQMVAEDADIWDAWSEVVAYERLGRNNLRSAIARVSADREFPTTWAPDLDAITRMAMSRVTRAAREKVTDDLAQAIAGARVLTDAEYEQLSDRRHGLGRAEQHALRRHEIAEFYGVQVDAELVKLDDGGRFRGAVRRLVTLEVLREGNRERAAQADLVALRYGLRNRTTHYAQSAVMLDAIMTLHGVPRSTDMLLYTGPLKTPSAKVWAALDGMAGAIRELVGVSVPDAVARAKEPMRFLSYVLRTIGLSLFGKLVGPKGTQTREYRIDPTDAAEALRVSRARRARLTGGGVWIQPTPEEMEKMDAIDRVVEEILTAA